MGWFDKLFGKVEPAPETPAPSEPAPEGGLDALLAMADQGQAAMALDLAQRRVDAAETRAPGQLVVGAALFDLAPLCGRLDLFLRGTAALERAVSLQTRGPE